MNGRADARHACGDNDVIYPLANLALRRPTQASSTAPEEGVAVAAAVNGSKQGSASFRSLVETDAWWQVDLGRAVAIGRLQLWSAERAPLRGVPFLPLAILASQDGVAWEILVQLHRPYGGGTTQRPAVLEFAQGVTARFIRVQGIGPGCLQFDELEAFRFIPPSRDSLVASVTLRPEKALDAITLKPRHDAGFFSVMSVILAEILHYRRAGLETTSIDDRDIFKKFKDGVGDSVLELVVDRHRWASNDDLDLLRPIPAFGARGRYSPNSMAYKSLDHAAITYFVDRYFTPSASVRALQAHWASKYDVEIGSAVVVCYRGTDKVTEVKPASFEDYADQIGRMAGASAVDIIVQTDQKQFLEFIGDRFPGRVKFIDDIPMTTGTTVIHNLDLTDEFGLTRRDFGLRLFAMAAWLSQARWLLTSSGNVGFWLALLRGHSRGLYQFHPHTQALIEPDDATVS